MNTKKLLVFFLVAAMLLSMIGCNQQQTPAAAESAAPAVEKPAAEEPAQTPVEEPVVEEPPIPENPVIRLSTTTSVNDSGLLPYLQPYFEKATGYQLEITSAGTGAAIEKGRTGDADCLLVHAKASEETFIEEGFSKERIPFMYNYFVIVGPAEDPVGVAACANATDAFKAIAEGAYPFVSRGDDSGTHKAELKIWKAAELEPDGEKDKWYISAGAGMGACLNMASEQQAYVLTDKATYLSHELRDTMKILLEKSDEMKNTYSMLAVSTDKWPDTNIDGANAFIEWMQSDEATALIDAYGVEEYKETLFFTM